MPKVALTGDPNIDHVLEQPGVREAIENPEINRRHEVPLAAGASEGDSDVTHIDRRIPETFTTKAGKEYSPDEFLNVHEVVEKWCMENLRLSYRDAHYDYALPAEKAAVEAAGIPWEEYCAHTAGSYAQIKDKKAKSSPPDLYTAPYEEEGVEHLLNPKEEGVGGSSVNRRAIENDIRSIIGRVSGLKVKVLFSDATELSPIMPDILRAEDMIALALADPASPLKTPNFLAAWHMVEATLMGGQDMRVIASEMPRLRWFASEAVPTAKDMPDDVVRAIAFQRYARMRTGGEPIGGIHIAIRRLFDRVMMILRQTKTMLGRKGVRRAADVRA